MRKIFFTLIIITCAIINVAAQTIEAYLKNNASSGNWAEAIWNISYTAANTETFDNFASLIQAHQSAATGLINIYFNNNAQLNMQAMTKVGRTILNYKSIQFLYTDGNEQTRTINGSDAINVTQIDNQTDAQQIFNVPVNFVATGSVNPKLTSYGPVIFEKIVTGENTSLTLNKATDDYLPDENYYIFNDSVKKINILDLNAHTTFNKAISNITTLNVNTNTTFNTPISSVNTLNVNARTTFNRPITVTNLNIAKEAELVTFKEDVVVENNAAGNGVSNYEKKLTVKGDLSTHDTTAIQMVTWVGGNFYIYAPLYILDSLTVGKNIQCSDFPINLMQSKDGTRKGFLQMNAADHIIPNLNVYNGGQAIIRNGRVDNLSFKKPLNEDMANLSTNIIMSSEEIGNLSFYRKANDSKKLPIKGTDITVTGNTFIVMDFPNPNSYYLVGFPFDVTVTGTAKEICEYDCVARSNGKIGWKLVPAGTTTLKAGKGYAILSNNELTFKAVNVSDKFSRTSGTQAIKYYKGTSTYKENYGWNLVTTPFANPQPLNITKGMFVYRYVPESDSYTTLQTGDAFTPNPFEAFFIKTAEGTETAEFGATQASMPSRIARAAQSRIELSLLADGYEYSTRINYNDNATTAYDALYDAPFSGGMMPNATWFYSFCAGQNGQYAINAVPEEIESINLGFRLMNTNGGTSYTIIWNNEAGMDLELYDTEMQIATDMVSLNSYSFMVANDGINTERFVIRKKNASGPTTSIEEVSENKNILIQEGTIIINTENSAHISIYDIMGHVIAEGDNKGQQQYNIGQPGIYIVKINGEATKVLVK